MTTKTIALDKGNIGKLLFRLAFPAIVAQLVNVLYNIMDRVFIGRMPNGQLAIAGIGVAFPIIMIISAFSALVGMGGAPLAAIKMGEKDKEGAEKIIGNSFFLLFVLGILLTIGLSITKEPILWKFGASKETFGFANDYLGIYILGTIFVQFTLGMNPFINTQGLALIGMLTVAVGAVVNIVLDPIFIFGLDMGVKGAALATIIAQFVSGLWVLYFFFGKEKVFKSRLFTTIIGKKSVLRIKKKYIKPDKKIVIGIIGLGVAPFIMQATESIVVIALNNQLRLYGDSAGAGVGDLAIGAAAIMASIMQIIILPMMGLAQGAQPIMSYNYGAKNFDRVKKVFRLQLAICMGYTILMGASLMLAPEFFVNIFNNDGNLVEMTTWSIRIFFAGIFMFGAQMACQHTFLALGQAKISLFLALLRKIVLLVPLIIVLPLFLEDQLQAVFLAEPIADIVAATTTIICFILFYRKNLSSKELKKL